MTKGMLSTDAHTDRANSSWVMSMGIPVLGGIYCRPGCQEWCQPEAHPVEPTRPDLDHGGRGRSLCRVQVQGRG